MTKPATHKDTFIWLVGVVKNMDLFIVFSITFLIVGVALLFIHNSTSLKVIHFLALGCLGVSTLSSFFRIWQYMRIDAANSKEL